jgi:hypothetical protein
MKSSALMRDFLRAAQLAHEATGLIAVREFSSHHTGGLWHLRDAQNESICEVSAEGAVVELSFEAPPGLLDRICDLHALGCSGRAIDAWFGKPAINPHLEGLALGQGAGQVIGPVEDSAQPAVTLCEPVCGD